MKKRFLEIDDMRGLAIFAMILIHTNWYFITDKLVFYLWDLSQFAVPVFIFCSAYIYFKRGDKGMGFSYLNKRFLRLLIPYYFFVFIFFLELFIFEPAKLNGAYIIQSLLLIGGIDINWLILLFLQLTFLMPLLAFLMEKKKIFFYLYTFLSIVLSFLIVFISVPFNYKYIMWFMWSPIIIYSMYFVKYHTKKWFYPLSFFFS